MLFSKLVRRVVFAAATAVSLIPSVSCAQEWRALWADSWHAGFMSSSEVTSLVNTCTTYNYNAVIVQMRRRGDAWYLPQAPNLEPRTTALTAGYDALQQLITQCHAANPPIQVHVWVPTYLIWSDSANAPTQASHVYNLHPEYLQKTSAGDTYVGEGYFLDPGNPDASVWNYNMAMDIASRYDIDGFHWDYVRYPQQDAGYNATAVSRYNAEFGLTGQPSVADSQWSTWRRRQITDFMRWANADLLAAKPNLVISTSVFADRSDAYTNRFQDWAAWNSEGIIDICMPMNYSATNSTFNTRVDDAYANRGVRSVYMGLGAYLNTASNTLTQLLYCRNKPLAGTNIYSYAVPNSGTVNQAATFQYIKTNFQPTYQSCPTLSWKATPTKGIIKGTVTRESDGAAVYNSTVSVNTGTPRTARTEPHGKYACFEVDPGSYTVSATIAGMGVGTSNVTVVAGQVITADVVIPAGDTTPPTISSVASGNITDVSAVITWTTNETANSTVEYGTTTAYGSTASNASQVLSHSISLASLTANTLYHYRVKSMDGSNNQSVSGDYTFTTLQSGQVADVIIDNPTATITGTWTLASSAPDKYGADYRYKGLGTGTAYLQYTPTILTAGMYDVYEWHCAGTNRGIDTPHVVAYNGGTVTVDVNQQIVGGAWNKIGQWNFAAGSAGSVKITDAITVSGQVAIADAIKFVYAGLPPPVPNAPSGLTATTISRTQINLAWTDNSTNETNFVVEYKKSSVSTWTVAATLAANTTAYSKTGLTRNTAYNFRVKATNATGSSAYSNTATATTLK